MTTRLEYLNKCITNSNLLETKNWYISCFGISILKDDLEWEKDLTRYRIVTKIDGLYYIDFDDENKSILVKIVDYKKNTPLFNMQEVIEIDSSWLPTIKGKIQTKIGRLIVNKVVLYDSIGVTINYLNEKINVKTIENIFSDKVKNKEDLKEGYVSVEQMKECVDRLNFLTNLSIIINVASTEKSITPPPGISEIKKKLLKEYENQLEDPVKVVELETKLSNIDKEYLSDDIAANTIFNNKSKTGRKKMFLMVGDTNDFTATGKGKVITDSLSEGLNINEDVFPAYMNDIRSGSFSRGSSTALGGYTYKILQRALSSIRIEEKPCVTTKGLKRLITKDNYKKLVNRYIKENSWKLISNIELASKYIDKIVEIRSPIYCKTEDNNVCYACMGENYKATPNGISNLAANVSAVILTIALKAMHGSVTETSNIELKDLCS